MSGVCQREGCGSPLPPKRGPQGRPRKWCSDRCRRQASFDRHHAPCVDCGGPLKQTGQPIRRCARCELERRRKISDETAQRVAAMWRGGMTGTQIAERLGWSKGYVRVALNRLRERGYDLPYRVSPEARAAMAAGATRRWAA